MQLGLASDDSNPNFAGAHDPDGALFVRFFDKEMDNEFETKLQGRPIKYMEIMVHIEKPGDNNSIIERISTKADEIRFPRQWNLYQRSKQGAPGEIVGTMLSDLPFLTPAIVAELKHFHFYTVEQVANASDAQLGGIGMAAGMAPHAFRDKARLFLRVAQDNSVAGKLAADLKAEKERNEKLAADMAAMQEQMKQLLSAPPKAKPGRKPKAVAA